MTYDPKRDPLTMHPLYSLMKGVLHVLNSTAYYDSGRWVMDRDEALMLVETTFKHKMERADEDVMEPPDDWDWDIERDDPQWDIERGT